MGQISIALEAHFEFRKPGLLRGFMVEYQSKLTDNAAGFIWPNDDVFGRIASRYDLLCDLFSFGLHRLWKRRMAQRIAGEAWDTLLDGATGTGDIMLRILSKISDKRKNIIAADISEKMLGAAHRKLMPMPSNVSLVRLDAENMVSISSASIDAYSISLALKICNRHRVLEEALRVLKPGGRLIVLEASNIRYAFIQRLYLVYMSICIPLLGLLMTAGDASAYKYLLKGVKEFPSAEGLATEMLNAGFESVEFERLTLGIVAIHVARKPLVGMLQV